MKIWNTNICLTSPVSIMIMVALLFSTIVLANVWTEEKVKVEGDTEDKKALKEHVKKRARIDEKNGNILIQDENGDHVLAEDTFRTAGTGQKVASGFGKEMRDCVIGKIDEKRASKGEKTEGYQSLEGLISRRYLV